MEIQNIVDKLIEDFCKSDLNLDGTGNNLSQKFYLEVMRYSYYKTIRDCKKFLPNKNANIVELGSYLGIVAKSLKVLGHNVTACDIPYFFDREEIKEYFLRSDIKSLAFNLRDYKIPLKKSSQDAVIACEIIEHLNFNPLPIIKEINRILKVGGNLYIATPNGDSLIKKIRYLFFGKQPSLDVMQFYEQLDSSKNMVVGLHWREYSLKEIKKMVLPFGFELQSKRFSSNVGVNHGGLIKILLKKTIFSLPGCKANQVLIFKKIFDSNPKLDINKDS